MTSSVGISRGLRGAASAVAMGVLACGGRAAPGAAAPAGTPAAAKGGPAAPAPVVKPLRDFLALEADGSPPADTTVVVTPGLRRVIVLRHGPPDNAVFAEVRLPAEAFDTASAGPVQVTVRPVPGRYGVVVETSRPLARPGTVLFSYARFFAAPAAALEKYGTDVAFERVLQVGAVLGDGQVAVLPSTHPAPDQLQATLAANGRYLVMGPR